MLSTPIPRRSAVGALGGLVALLLVAPLALAFVSVESDRPGVSTGPGNVTVLDEGWEIEVVADDLDFPVGLAERDGRLLVLQAGRYHYAGPYDGQDVGLLQELQVADGVTTQRTVARGLADPAGLTVTPSGDIYLTEYGRVLHIDAEEFEHETRPAMREHSFGYPPQTTDFPYPPATDDLTRSAVEEVFRVDTTGAMGMAVDEASEQLYVLGGVDGPAPDDPVVRDLSGQGYHDDFSSSLIAPTGGALTADQVVARGCRNCFGLTQAPEWSEHGGLLFATENTGPYRGRVTAGPGRSPIEGSTTSDLSVFDGVNVVDLEDGTFRRVVHLRPDSATLGTVPTGLQFAPPETPTVGGELLVALFSGYAPEMDNRGEIHIATPDLEHGLGHSRPFAIGFDFPTDLLVTGDGAIYVIEFFTGNLYQLVKR